MDGFIICLAICALTSVTVIPIVSLVILVRSSRRQERTDQQISGLLKNLSRQLDLIKPSSSSEASVRPRPQEESDLTPLTESHKDIPVKQPASETVYPLHVAAEPQEGAPEEAGDSQEDAADASPSTPFEFDSHSAKPEAIFSDPEPSASEAAPQPSDVPPRQPNAFEAAARQILHKCWNWITIGEDHRPAGVSMEYAVATTWLLRAGVIILVMGVGFFLKYSVERGFIGPAGRVALSLIVGLAMLISGTQMLGRKYHLLGQGLMGGGIATLYFAVFAAANLYKLVGVYPAFGLMVLVTVCAGGISVRFNSVLMAVLGILGGYGTPAMLSTGQVNFVGLFSYMMVLGCGVFGISYRRQWHVLNLLSFTCNFALVLGALHKHYSPAYFWQVMPFLVAFFCLYSTMVFIFNLVHRVKSTMLELLALLANAGIFFVLSHGIVSGAYSSAWVGAVTLGLGAFYVVHVYAFLMWKLADRELLFTFTGLSAFFLAVTIPLVLSPVWVTVCWAIQAFIMLWIAGKLNSAFLRHVSYLLYVIVLYRFCVVDLYRQFAAAKDIQGAPFLPYLLHLIERIIAFGIPIASIAGSVGLLKRPAELASLSVDRGNDIGEWIHERLAIRVVLAAAVGMLFLYINLELNRTLGDLLPPFRLPALSLVWLVMCAFLLKEYLDRGSAAIGVLLFLFCGGLLLKLMFVDLSSWRLSSTFLYRQPYSFIEAAMRLVDFGAIIGCSMLAFHFLSRQTDERRLSDIFSITGLILLFVYLTLETNTFLHVYLPGFRPGGLSILWSLFALGLLLRGIWRGVRPLRIVGLVLFTIVVGKAFFIDLSGLDQIYRIVAFVALGILALSGSFIYMKYRQTFTTEGSETEPAENQSEAQSGNGNSPDSEDEIA